jgi:hypothetical protein
VKQVSDTGRRPVTPFLTDDKARHKVFRLITNVRSTYNPKVVILGVRREVALWHIQNDKNIAKTSSFRGTLRF